MDDQREDEEIVASVLLGRTEEFRVLILRHSRWINSLVRRYLHGSDAEDAAQETFIKAFYALKSFRNEGKFQSWLSTIAVRCCYSKMRKQRRMPETESPPSNVEYERWLDAVARNEAFQRFTEGENLAHARKTLQWAMSSLGAEDRMIISLLYFEDRSVGEIAKILECTETRIKVRAHRSKKKLRAALQSLIRAEEK